MEDAISLEAKQIAKGIKLDDKIECTAKNPAFITLKDHKQILEQVHLAGCYTRANLNLAKIAK